FFFQAEDGIRGDLVTGVQTCALPISTHVPPEELRTLLLAVEPAPALARDQAAQEPKGRRPVALVSPVEVFRVVAVVAEQPRVPSELLPDELEPLDRPVAPAGLHGGAVKGQ